MNKKGFTLIELLAIIVILAIIAVVTVPLILGIIDNAKEKAVMDSAYGYKDAVNKMYTTKLLNNKDYKMEDRVYTISELNTEGLSVSGKEPESNSWIQIENNNAKSGCLQFDEYRVTISDGVVGNAEKGECLEPLPCPGPNCVYAYYTDVKNYGKNGTGSVLSDYTYDYMSLEKYHGEGDVGLLFLGHILDADGRIERGFLCGTRYNGNIFCLEGTTDGSKYEVNKNILLEDKICTYDYPDSEYEYTYQHGCSWYMVTDWKTGGVETEVNDPSISCRVNNDGTMYCGNW